LFFQNLSNAPWVIGINKTYKLHHEIVRTSEHGLKVEMMIVENIVVLCKEGLHRSHLSFTKIDGMVLK